MVWPLIIGAAVSALSSSASANTAKSGASADKPEAGAKSAGIGQGDAAFTESMKGLTERIRTATSPTEKQELADKMDALIAKKQAEQEKAAAPPAKQDSSGGGNMLGGLVQSVLGMFTGGGAKA